MSKQTIYHIAEPEDLALAQTTGLYSSKSLSESNFIHCCLKEQLAGVAERYYANVSGLQLLEIDTAKLKSDLVYENTVGGQELFPHIYGQINMTAVSDIRPLHDNLG